MRAGLFNASAIVAIGSRLHTAMYQLYLTVTVFSFARRFDLGSSDSVVTKTNGE